MQKFDVIRISALYRCCKCVTLYFVYCFFCAFSLYKDQTPDREYATCVVTLIVFIRSVRCDDAVKRIKCRPCRVESVHLHRARNTRCFYLATYTLEIKTPQAKRTTDTCSCNYFYQSHVQIKKMVDQCVTCN